MYVLSSNKTERPLKPGPWPSPVAAATGFTSLTLQLLGTFFTHKCLLTTNNSQQVDHYFHRLFHKCILSLCTNSQWIDLQLFSCQNGQGWESVRREVSWLPGASPAREWLFEGDRRWILMISKNEINKQSVCVCIFPCVFILRVFIMRNIMKWMEWSYTVIWCGSHQVWLGYTQPYFSKCFGVSVMKQRWRVPRVAQVSVRSRMYRLRCAQVHAFLWCFGGRQPHGLQLLCP